MYIHDIVLTLEHSTLGLEELALESVRSYLRDSFIKIGGEISGRLL